MAEPAGTARARPEGPAAPIDRDALLAALVLAPATYSRNRFFEMYKDPEARRVRRRAAHLRGVVRQVVDASAQGAVSGADLRFADAAHGRVELSYEVAALGLRRRVLLDPLELALVRFALARAKGAPATDDPDRSDPDRARVEAALARLAPEARPL